jgi:DNA polymerase (family 10)
MKNREVADLFEKMADLLEFKDENPFKVRAYRRASRIVGDLTQDIEDIAQNGKLKDVPGIGEGMAEKIGEYLKTGKVSKFEEVRKGIPDGLIALMDIPGMGPKTLSMFHKEKGISKINMDDRIWLAFDPQTLNLYDKMSGNLIVPKS